MVKDREISLLAIRTAKIIKEDREDELSAARKDYEKEPFSLPVNDRFQLAKERLGKIYALLDKWDVKL